MHCINVCTKRKTTPLAKLEAIPSGSDCTIQSTLLPFPMSMFLWPRSGLSAFHIHVDNEYTWIIIDFLDGEMKFFPTMMDDPVV